MFILISKDKKKQLWAFKWKPLCLFLLQNSVTHLHPSTVRKKRKRKKKASKPGTAVKEHESVSTIGKYTTSQTFVPFIIFMGSSIQITDICNRSFTLKVIIVLLSYLNRNKISFTLFEMNFLLFPSSGNLTFYGTLLVHRRCINCAAVCGWEDLSACVSVCRSHAWMCMFKSGIESWYLCRGVSEYSTLQKVSSINLCCIHWSF